MCVQEDAFHQQFFKWFDSIHTNHSIIGPLRKVSITIFNQKWLAKSTIKWLGPRPAKASKKHFQFRSFPKSALPKKIQRRRGRCMLHRPSYLCCWWRRRLGRQWHWSSPVQLTSLQFNRRPLQIWGWPLPNVSQIIAGWCGEQEWRDRLVHLLSRGPGRTGGHNTVMQSWRFRLYDSTQRGIARKWRRDQTAFNQLRIQRIAA